MTNQDLEACKRDIEIIKSTIEKSKVNLGSLSALFILYGIIMLLDTVATGFVAHAIYITQDWYLVYENILHVLRMIVLGLFIFYYANRFLKLRKSNNFFTLQLFGLWGFVMLFVPLMNTCFIAVTKAVCGNELYMGANPQLIICSIPGILEVFSFVFALMATGLMLNKRTITVASACLFIALLMLYFVLPSTITVIENHEGIMIYNYIGLRTNAGRTVTFLGYVIMGILLRRKKSENYGT